MKNMRTARAVRRAKGILPIATAIVLVLPLASQTGAQDLSREGWSYLHLAAEEGRVDKVRCLLFGGHEVDEKIDATEAIATAISRAESANKAAIKELMEVLEPFNRRVRKIMSDHEQASRKFRACRDKPSKSERRSCEAEIDRESKKRKPASKATAGGDTSSQLASTYFDSIQRGGEVFVLVMSHGATALHIASGEGHDEVIELLIEKGANVEAKTSSTGMTPLHWAAMGDNPRAIRTLIARGASVSELTEKGWNALHLAALTNSIQAARELFANGINPNAEATAKAVRPMDIVLARGSKSLLMKELIRSRGGKCNYRCPR